MESHYTPTVVRRITTISSGKKTANWTKNRHSTAFNTSSRPQKRHSWPCKLHGRPWKLESPVSFSLLHLFASVILLVCPWWIYGCPCCFYGRHYEVPGWLKLSRYCSLRGLFFKTFKRFFPVLAYIFGCLYDNEPCWAEQLNYTLPSYSQPQYK